MCGIIYCEDLTGNPVNKLVAKQFEAQQHRGTEGFGFYDRTRNRLKKTPKQRKILSQLRNAPSSSILFHHRFPTSTDNVKNACHPFSTKDFFKTNYVLVHNGHISNSRVLKMEHEKLGITYTSVQQDGSFNDSEALLWDVALYLEGKQDKLEAYGGIAFIVMAMPSDRRKPTLLHFGRNSNPIKMLFSETMIMLSSEGEGIDALSNTLYTYNYTTNKLSTKLLTVPSYPVYTGTPSYAWSDEDDDFVGNSGFKQFRPYADYSPSTNWEQQKALPFGDEVNTDYRVPYATDNSRFVTNKEQLIILPKNENYTWNEIMSECKQDFVFENNQGFVISIKSAVADRVEQYLDETDGRYKVACDLIQYDINGYEKSLIQDCENGLVEDQDDVLELDLLKLAQYSIGTCSYWHNDDSVDYDFNDDYTSAGTAATKAFLAQSALANNFSNRI